MKYKAVWKASAEEDLKEIGDRTIAENIKHKVEKHLVNNPIQHGKPLWGKWEGFYRHRVDDYRVIYQIREKELVILVVKVGHRREVY